MSPPWGRASKPQIGAWPGFIVMPSRDNMDMKLRDNISDGGDVDFISLMHAFHDGQVVMQVQTDRAA